MKTQYIFKYDWFSHNIPVWEQCLADFKGKANLNFLEIGSFEGRSAVWLLDNILLHESSRLFCVDSFQQNSLYNALELDLEKALSHFKYNTAEFGKRVKLIIDSSGRALKNPEYFKDESLDFIYIDGSHDAKNVLEDSVLSWRLLKPGGVLIFDDYELNLNLPDLKKPRIAIDGFLYTYQDEYTLVSQGYQIVVRKNI